ncbi:MAG: hypothetical protein M1826_003594 [Phylliscum demangeonii]|nr:MAG: hypothetical protein M1826_003594 [Phylliscum demangeonii]
MAGSEIKNSTSKKRKRGEEEARSSKPLRPKSRAWAKEQVEDEKKHILHLESQVLESRKHYNNLAELITIASSGRLKEGTALTAALSLCRLFTSLTAAGRMRASRAMPETELVVVQWLKSKCQAFSDLLLRTLRSATADDQLPALVMLMRLVKAQGGHVASGDGYSFPRELLKQMMQALMSTEDGQEVREYFVSEFMEKCDDVRYFALSSLADIEPEGSSPAAAERHASHALSILSSLPPSSEDSAPSFLVGRPCKARHPVLSATAHKLRAQEAWIQLLRQPLTAAQQHQILALIPHQIAPWFAKPELLMDFLTDAYSAGGATALLALAGLFHLMQAKNLDYPHFYPKLYSQLDGALLHSRHRSRFFRLLDTFLASSHLPAALVASFMKRLARRALFAPPGAVVMIIPWIYNMTKRHPACAFMLHRVGSDAIDDGFDDAQPDPLHTHALEASSLWEIQALQCHHHPNVATLAKILGQPFTKQAYQLEDFLDHSYASILHAELGRVVKQPPAVEWCIPKHVFATAKTTTIATAAAAAAAAAPDAHLPTPVVDVVAAADDDDDDARNPTRLLDRVWDFT